MRRTFLGMAMMAALFLVSTTHMFAADPSKSTKPAETKITKTAKTAAPASTFKVGKITVVNDIDKTVETALKNELAKNIDKASVDALKVTATWSGKAENQTLVLNGIYRGKKIEKTAALKGAKPVSDAAGTHLLATDASKQLALALKGAAGTKVALRDPKTATVASALKQ